MGEHIKSYRNDIQITGTLAITKKGTLNAVRAGHEGQLGGGNAGTAVIVRMDADDGSLTILHIAAEVLNLVRISIGSAHFHSGGQIKDNRIFLSSAHFLHYGLANSDGEVDFCAGEALRRVFIANIHATASHLFLGELLD